MDLLILGGMSQHNKEWIRQVGAELSPLFKRTITHDYAHWSLEGGELNFEMELSAIKSHTRELDEYVIFAKSAGVVLSLKGIAQKALQPAACLFVGTPLGFARQQGHQMGEWLKVLTVPAMFVQNSHDPAGSYRELEDFLRQHSSLPHSRILELPGETHQYADLAKLKKFMLKLIEEEGHDHTN